MPSSIRYRRARPADLPEAWSAARRDWGLVPASMWGSIPSLLGELLTEGRLFLVIFEDVVRHVITNMGCYAFPQPAFFRQARAAAQGGVFEQILRAEARRERVLLNWREVARANAAGELEMLSCFSTPDFDASDCLAEIGVIVEAYSFFVRGYQVRDSWQENAHPKAAPALAEMGYSVVREVRRASGEVVSLMHLSMDDARRAPGTFVGAMMQGLPPRFGFTPREQSLLELALLDWSDQDAADWLGVTPEAVKKRWRAIYSKVRTLEPELLNDDRGSGSALRHAVLSRVRHNPQELRPYAPRRVASAAGAGGAAS